MVAVLRRVELESGATRDILRAQWIDQLHRIPGEDAWSPRIDKGDGVQLYRIEMDDSIKPLIVHLATAIFGDTEGAVYPGYGHAPLATGVRAHDWRSEEHTSELQSLIRRSDAVICLKKNKKTTTPNS